MAFFRSACQAATAPPRLSVVGRSAMVRSLVALWLRLAWLVPGQRWSCVGKDEEEEAHGGCSCLEQSQEPTLFWSSGCYYPAVVASESRPPQVQRQLRCGITELASCKTLAKHALIISALHGSASWIGHQNAIIVSLQ